MGPKKESESESAFLGSKTGKNNEISADFKEFYFLKKENGAVFRENAVWAPQTTLKRRLHGGRKQKKRFDALFFTFQEMHEIQKEPSVQIK